MKKRFFILYGCACVALVAGLFFFHQHAVRKFNRTLCQTTGLSVTSLPITVSNAGISLWSPALHLFDVRIANFAKIPRVTIQPKRHIYLVHPTFQTKTVSVQINRVDLSIRPRTIRITAGPFKTSYKSWRGEGTAVACDIVRHDGIRPLPTCIALHTQLQHITDPDLRFIAPMITGKSTEQRRDQLSTNYTIRVKGAFKSANTELLNAPSHLGHTDTTVNLVSAHQTWRWDQVAIQINKLSLQLLRNRLPDGLKAALLPQSTPQVTGKIELKKQGETYRMTTAISVTDLVLQHDVLASTSIKLPLMRLNGSGLVAADKNKWSIDNLKISTNNAAAFIRTTLSKQSIPQLHVSLPKTPCQSVLNAMPADMIPILKGMILRGTMTARAVFQPPHDLSFDIDTTQCQVVRDAPLGQPNRLTNRPSLTIVNGSGEVQRWLATQQNPHYRRLHNISPNVIAAFLAAEDQHFFQHKGFDPESLQRALQYNLEQGALSRGGSTITQQLVKNYYLSGARTLSRKLQEAVLTWRIEQVLSKRQILELYLNSIELGRGIYGVELASQKYFQRSAAQLSAEQAALLAALTPSPRLFVRYLSTDGGAPTRKPDLQWTSRLKQIRSAMRYTRVRYSQMPRLHAKEQPVTKISLQF